VRFLCSLLSERWYDEFYILLWSVPVVVFSCYFRAVPNNGLQLTAPSAVTLFGLRQLKKARPPRPAAEAEHYAHFIPFLTANLLLT